MSYIGRAAQIAQGNHTALGARINGPIGRAALGDATFDSIVNAGISTLQKALAPALSNATKAVSQQGGSILQDLEKTPEFAKVLALVQAKAKAGVVDAVKQNAWPLFAWAVAGGAVGGILLGKRGWVGASAAGALAAVSGITIYRNISAGA